MTSETILYRFERSPRSPRAIATLSAWWCAATFLYVALNAHPGVIALLLLFTLPAVYELGTGRSSSLTFTDKEIRWTTGNRDDAVPRAAIKRVRLDTRLDLSVRMSIERHHGRDIRVPYDCLPRTADLEAALNAADLAFMRTRFSLMG